MPPRKRKNPFAEMTFGDLTKVAYRMIRKEYDYTGLDYCTHFMSLTEVLMQHHDRTRDQLMRETIRGLVGRVQAAHGVQDFEEP